MMFLSKALSLQNIVLFSVIFMSQSQKRSTLETKVNRKDLSKSNIWKIETKLRISVPRVQIDALSLLSVLSNSLKSMQMKLLKKRVDKMVLTSKIPPVVFHWIEMQVYLMTILMVDKIQPPVVKNIAWKDLSFSPMFHHQKFQNNSSTTSIPLFHLSLSAKLILTLEEMKEMPTGQTSPSKWELPRNNFLTNTSIWMIEMPSREYKSLKSPKHWSLGKWSII